MGKRSFKVRKQRLVIFAIVLVCLLYSWLGFQSSRAPTPQVMDSDLCRKTYPLTWKHIYLTSGSGGAWYIPPQWIGPDDPTPKNIVEAAHLAYKLANSSSSIIPYSSIPLILHQTWKDTDVPTWPVKILAGVEKWLTYATIAGDGAMAYFLWLDSSCQELIHEAVPEISNHFMALPLPVERADVFRVVVSNSIGGIYGDIDTMPLRSPASWLDRNDLAPWKDPLTASTYSNNAKTSIRLILGIEADNDPHTDAHWRMGYNFPVQLTQWALAAAPNHPILNLFVKKFARRMEELEKLNVGGTVVSLQRILRKEDPLKLTGPEAITVATMEWLKQNEGLRWEAVTGLKDGGRSKAIGDTMIFPITAFSPGRGSYGNMGSKPITDPDARLLHSAQGSWRKLYWKVELGKLCRTVLGRCKDWSKVPD